MNALRVFTSEIRQHDGLYSLNDLHQAAGGARKHQPANFIRVDTTVALMEEISSSDVRIIPAKTIRGRGKPQGTYVCKELVYAYAMWISPKFHLAVIRAFDALQQPATQTDTPTHQRWMVYRDPLGQQHTVPISNDAYVLTLEQIVRGVGCYQDLPFRTAQLAEIAESASRQLRSALAGPVRDRIS
jgi:hypothetical protein